MVVVSDPENGRKVTVAMQPQSIAHTWRLLFMALLIDLYIEEYLK